MSANEAAHAAAVEPRYKPMTDELRLIGDHAHLPLSDILDREGVRLLSPVESLVLRRIYQLTIRTGRAERLLLRRDIREGYGHLHPLPIGYDALDQALSALVAKGVLYRWHSHLIDPYSCRIDFATIIELAEADG